MTPTIEQRLAALELYTHEPQEIRPRVLDVLEEFGLISFKAMAAGDVDAVREFRSLHKPGAPDDGATAAPASAPVTPHKRLVEAVALAIQAADEAASQHADGAAEGLSQDVSDWGAFVARAAIQAGLGAS